MSLPHALLGLLSEQPASGYDLLKRFDEGLSAVWPAQKSQVYSELAKLDENGLIEITGTGARQRREYGITDAGRAELRRWLTEPDLDLAFRSAALLRVFFLWTLNSGEGAAYLEKFADHNHARLTALKTIHDNAKWVGDPVQVCGWLMLEYGLRGSETAEQWARWAAGELTERLDTPS